MISPACLMAGVIYIIIYKERDFPQVIRYILQKVSFSYWIRSLFGYLCLYNSFSDLFPVNKFPESLYICSTAITIVDIVCMFPYINNQ